MSWNHFPHQMLGEGRNKPTENSKTVSTVPISISHTLLRFFIVINLHYQIIRNRDIKKILLWDNNVKKNDGVVAMFRLKQLRRDRGISQVKLSMELNMGQNTISRYENEVHQADYKTLILFADYFDVSIDYLLGRTNNPKMNK